MVEPLAAEAAHLATEEPPSKQQRTSLPSPDVPMVSQDSDINSNEELEKPPSPQNRFNETLDDHAARLNYVFDEDDAEPTRDLESVLDHCYVNGVIELCCKYSTGDTIHDKEWHPLSMVQDEDPYTVAKYILENDFGFVQNGRLRRWARAFLRNLKKTLRRLKQVDWNGFCASTFFPTPIKPPYRSRRSRRSRADHRDARRVEKVKNKRPSKKKVKFKYGIEISKSWADILRIDTAAGNSKWQDAVKKEVSALIRFGCFQFLDDKKYKPPSDFQYASLHFVYEVKTDLRQKARLVCDGS